MVPDCGPTAAVCDQPDACRAGGGSTPDMVERLRSQPDRWDLVGATICLIGVAVIMYAPRG